MARSVEMLNSRGMVPIWASGIDNAGGDQRNSFPQDPLGNRQQADRRKPGAWAAWSVAPQVQDVRTQRPVYGQAVTHCR